MVSTEPETEAGKFPRVLDIKSIPGGSRTLALRVMSTRKGKKVTFGKLLKTKVNI
jgi:hypothetical protein